MKKIFITIVLILVLSGCTNKKWYSVTSDIDDSQYETIVLNAGEKFALDLSYFEQKYQFKAIKFYYDSSIVRVNHKEELLALQLGKTTLSATIYSDDSIQSVRLFYIIVVDYNDPRMIPINNQLELRRFMVENPMGYYYLNNDIDMSRFHWVEPIPYFEGILINPNKYIIKGLTITSSKDCALIRRGNNVYIDGLILEDIKITGKENAIFTDSIYTAGLIGTANNSYLSNIHISGEVKQGIYVGGIAANLNNTTLINSSFTGKLSGGQYIGGLVGYHYPDTLSKSKIKGIIKNCYAICDISGGYYDKAEFGNILGGLVGQSSGGVIKSSYYCGKITPDEIDYHKPIIGCISASGSSLIDVYYVSDYELEEAYTPSYYVESSVYKISLEELKSGKVLKGFEDFIFEEDKFPYM